MHRRLPPLAAITLNASTSVETSLFNIDHIQRTINSYAVSLKYRLRNIKTNRANLAHGLASTQPPYGTSMPQSGRRSTASTTDITLIQA
jgi:hypothetical protein